MSEVTPHTGLKKPLESETADISVINENMDKIDSALGDLAGVPTTAKTAAGAITELFTNVSDGKALIASTITDKGVPTDANDTFAEMADNIESIPVGPDTSDATATAADILAPKTAYGAEGTKLTGTMVDRGNMSFTPGPTAQTIPEGKHGGGGQVAAVVVPADKVLAGTTIAGTAGTMPNRVGDTAALASSVAGTTLKLRASKGYRDGVDDNVTIADANFITENIFNGVSLFGKQGTLQKPILLSAPTTRSTNSTTYVSLKKVTPNISGTFEVSFQALSPTTTGYARIYKNGIPIGIERSFYNTYVIFTEDIAVNAGDVVELYARGQGGATVQISLFKLTIPAFVSPYNGVVNVD